MRPTKDKRFLFLLLLVIIERCFSLWSFGFNQTDIDQTVMWNGAMDYANGVFHEPFFYGQAYNYMLEAFLAAPLLWCNIPVYIALPIVTSALSIFPFIALAIVLHRKGYTTWSYLALIVLLLLPSEYGFLTSLSRGWVQAHLFLPLLFAPLITPQNPKYYTQSVIGISLCTVFNTSSLLLTLPIFIYYASHHLKKTKFYLNLLWAIPILVLDQLAKYYYKLHPETVMHKMGGKKISIPTFIETLQKEDILAFVSPILPYIGPIYFFALVALLIINLKKKNWLSGFIVGGSFLLLTLTLFVPKIQERYPDTGVYFTPSRLYLTLPLLLILLLFITYQRKLQLSSKKLSFILLLPTLIFLGYKGITLKNTSSEQAGVTVFPVMKNSKIVANANQLNTLVKEYGVDAVIHSTYSSYDNTFFSYTFNPITGNEKSTISLNQEGDRRTWLYKEALSKNRILLSEVPYNKDKLPQYKHKVIDEKYTFIELSNEQSFTQMIGDLEISFGAHQ